jgi:hypothetical protein
MNNVSVEPAERFEQDEPVLTGARRSDYNRTVVDTEIFDRVPGLLKIHREREWRNWQTRET